MAAVEQEMGEIVLNCSFRHEPRTPADISFAAMNLMSELEKKKSPIHARLLWSVLVCLKEKQ